MAELRVTNESNERRLIFFEPYGEDYWLKKGDHLVVHAVDPEGDQPFQVDLTDDGITVWINAKSGYITDDEGRELPTGHQRPSDKFPGVPRPPSADPA